MIALVFLSVFLFIGIGVVGSLHRIADAVEAQNRHYGIEAGESGTTGAEEQS